MSINYPLAGTYALSEKNIVFARLLSENGDIPAAAKAAGVTRSYAYDLVRTPAVQAAVAAEVRRKLTIGAPVALSTLIEVVSDKSVSPGTRVKAATAILDRAGFVAPRAAPLGSGVEKTLNEMSIDELKDLAAKLEDELAGRAKAINAPPKQDAPSQASDMLD